jgi:hypothetical protein
MIIAAPFSLRSRRVEARRSRKLNKIAELEAVACHGSL